MVRKKVAIFVALAFALDWVPWLVAGLVTGSFSEGISGMPWTVLLAVGMFGPTAAALITNRVVGKGAAVDLALCPRLKRNLGLYLLALLLPSLLTAAGALLFFLLLPEAFDAGASVFANMAQRHGVDAAQISQLLAIQLAANALLNPFISMLLAVGEEVGWRGFLLPSLAERLSAPRAVLLTGVVWGLWHAPVIAMGYNFGFGYPGFPVFGMLVMVIACVAFGSFFGWLRLRSQSVWPCALAHGALNSVGSSPLYFCPGGMSVLGPVPLGLVSCVPTLVVAVLFLRGCRRASLTPSGGADGDGRAS